MINCLSVGNMSVATVHADSSVGRHEYGNFLSDASNRSDVCDFAEETIELPYHGNCPKCHHSHTNRPLIVYKDKTKHTRLECDACQYPLLGIGRASTQTTLASVESLIPPPRHPSRHGGGLPPSNLHIYTSVPLNTNQTGHSPLSGITEVHSAGRSPSGSTLEGTGFIPHPHEVTGARPQASVPNNLDATRDASAQGTQPQSGSNSQFDFKSLLARGKARLLKRSRVIKVFGSRLWKSKTVLPPSSTPQPRPVAPHDEALPLDTSASISSFQEGERSLERPLVEGTPLEPESKSQISLSPISEAEGRPRSAGDVVESRGDRDPATRAKMERIYARRREATLKSNAYRKTVCRCGPGCVCLGGGEIDSDAGSESRGTRPSSIQISDMIPHHVLHNDLFGIGSHLDPDPNASLVENSIAGVEINQQQQDRWSQDATGCESNLSLT